MSSPVYEAIQKLLESREPINRHSFYQLKYFVLGKEHTIQAKLRKCLNELAARKDSLEHLQISIEDTHDEIALIDLKIAKMAEKLPENPLHSTWLEIQARKLERRKKHTQSILRDLTKKLRECEEETAFFLSAYQQLEAIEPLKSFDDPAKESEYWNEQLAHEMQLRILLKKPLEVEMVKTILALDPKAPIRIEMINILEQLQEQAGKSRIEDMNRAIEVARDSNTPIEETECRKESRH